MAARTRQLTISDVAAEAGVSIATVSKVINDRYGVAAETSKRVREVIDRLGYQSSLVAQSLRSRRTQVIGVLATDIEPFSAEVLKGAARALRGTGYDLVVFSDCGRRQGHLGWERTALSRVSSLADGVLLVTPSVAAVEFASPVVAIDHNVGAPALPSIDSDNFHGAVAATEYLIRLGHRRIGFISGRPDLASARLREDGYRRALEDARIGFDPALVALGAFHAEPSGDATTRLLALDDPPTAIFAANDVSALAAISVARDRGLSVPDDLSVIGFDNVPESALSDPPLTTIDQFVQRMGARAVEMLLRLVETPSLAPEHVVLPTQLVVRGSCGPPRQTV